MSEKKFISEKQSIELSKNRSLFEYADQIKMRIPTSCGRFGDCHECIVEVSEGYDILSKPTEHENFLKEPFRLACQANTVSKDSNLKFSPRKRDRKILTNFSQESSYDVDHNYIYKDNTLIYKSENKETILSKSKKIYGLAIDVGTTLSLIHI